MSEKEDLSEILRARVEGEVEFILVGGMAAVLHGAPVTTLDLDIVHSRTEDNISRLMAVLTNLDTRYRGQPKDRVLRPEASALAGNGHHNLATAHGPLDLLCELDEGVGYDELLPDSERFEDGEIGILVISLARLVELKTATMRPKDRVMLPILLMLLKQKDKEG